MNDKCPINTDCKLSASSPEQCTEACWKYNQLIYQYRHSNIPVKYRLPVDMTLRNDSPDLACYKRLADISADVYSFVAEGRGVFLASANKGNGKTTWATKLMLSYFRHMPRTIRSYEEPFGLFVNVPELFDKLRLNMEANDPDVQKFEAMIKEAPLVIFDDIGTEAPTNWVREKLYIYINSRVNNLKSCIFTSNVDLDILESEAKLGTRIVDRIYECSEIITFQETSRRRTSW